MYGYILFLKYETSVLVHNILHFVDTVQLKGELVGVEIIFWL